MNKLENSKLSEMSEADQIRSILASLQHTQKWLKNSDNTIYVRSKALILQRLNEIIEENPID